MKIPTDPKDIKALREFFEQQRTQVCSLADCLEEPWRTHFNGLKKEYDDVLAGLPPTDAAPAALEASKSLSAFASLKLLSANALNSEPAQHVHSLKASAGTALNSAVDAAVKERITKGELVLASEVPGRIEAAVSAELEKRTKAGELVPKVEVTQLCSAAKDTGVKEGRAALEQEQKDKAQRDAMLNTRKEQLATASLPIPEQELEKILGGTDEEFNALKTAAVERMDGLKKAGVAFNSKNPLFLKVYLPKGDWDAFESLVKEIPALKGAGGPEPLAGAGGTPDNVVPMGIY